MNLFSFSQFYILSMLCIYIFNILLSICRTVVDITVYKEEPQPALTTDYNVSTCDQKEMVFINNTHNNKGNYKINCKRYIFNCMLFYF